MQNRLSFCPDRYFERMVRNDKKLQHGCEFLHLCYPDEKGAGKDKFVHSARHCSKPEHLDLMLKKGIYPYDYMNSWVRMDETA